MDIKERLKKIYALALNGTEGEQEAAKATLEKLCRKYKVQLEDLREDEDAINEYLFRYKDIDECDLIAQIAYKVLNRQDCVYIVRRQRKLKALKVKCTREEQIEIEILYKMHKALWRKEVDRLFMAYIYKHKLFCAAKDENNSDTDKTLDINELEKIMDLVDNLSDEEVEYQKRLTTNSGKI